MGRTFKSVSVHEMACEVHDGKMKDAFLVIKYILSESWFLYTKIIGQGLLVQMTDLCDH
jgi:hypothetical protein